MKEITSVDELEEGSFYYVCLTGTTRILQHGMGSRLEGVGYYRTFGPVELPTLEDILKQCEES